MAKVLLFQCTNEIEIRRILTPMKISVISVSPQSFHLTLGELEKQKDSNSVALRNPSCSGGEKGGDLAESLMVMCDVTEKQMNRLLLELRRKEIRVDYKAILTPINRNWNVKQMYFEMAKEKAAYLKLKK